MFAFAPNDTLFVLFLFFEKDPNFQKLSTTMFAAFRFVAEVAKKAAKKAVKPKKAAPKKKAAKKTTAKKTAKK